MVLDYSKFDRVDEFAEERKDMVVDEVLKVRRFERERKLREEAQGSKKANAPEGGRRATCTVSCDGVTLKLTLSAKLLERSLAGSLVDPFLKAFSKKRADQPAVTSADVVGATVDGREITDLSKALQQRASDVLLDSTLRESDPTTMVSRFHEPWQPAAGAMWDTTHTVTLQLANAGDGGAEALDGLRLEENAGNA